MFFHIAQSIITFKLWKESDKADNNINMHLNYIIRID